MEFTLSCVFSGFMSELKIVKHVCSETFCHVFVVQFNFLALALLLCYTASTNIAIGGLYLHLLCVKLPMPTSEMATIKGIVQAK